ncbi:PTS sugar transporter subunit IIA [Wukongibacter sp. M2B1]|uniref:PTS sugar transporter subunit IIA n=1 Tax=Wukongibacter sp. M2B1 TaxID=3088895 RepID=UPI003D7AA7FE
MVGVVLASHGKLAEEMLKSVEMIMGPQENIIALALEPEDDPMELKERIKESVEKVKGDNGAIVLVDLMGGSPSNAAAYVAREGIPVITGMNLSILLELIGMCDKLTDELVLNIIEAGKEGIIDMREIFRGLN